MVLRKLKNCLQPAGYLVLSLPNVAHASVRLALLNGDFNYSEEGIIDRTHLRFFTLASIVLLAREAQYQIRELRRTRVGVFNTEVKLSIENIAVSVLRRMMRDPEATTYQFILAAVPQKEEQPGSEVAFDPSHFVDRTWSFRRGKHRLARSLMRKGRTLLREQDCRAARAWLYRSFMLQPRMQTFMYLFLSWKPRFGARAR
jgi:hypothetical protein